MRYIGLNTKIRAMRGKMLNSDDFRTLCSFRSVEEMGRRLQDYPGYGEALSGLEAGDMHRNILERKLILALSEDFSRIYRFITDRKLREFLSGFYLYTEIGVIKLLLCMIYDERGIVYTMPELSMLVTRKFRINIQSLMDARTVPDFVEALKGTPYYGVLSGRFGGDSSLFDMEMQLDLYYYMNLWKLLDEALDGRNRRVMRELAGTEIDLRNIAWIYRLKNSYAVDTAKLYSYLIPIRYRLTAPGFARMAEAADINGLMGEIAETPYGAAFRDFTSIDEVFYRRMTKAYADAARAFPGSLARTAGYIFGKQLEINNLTTAMECVRYGLDCGEARKYLHLYGKKAGGVTAW
ncbi:MAG: V-type ATPase subunit [Firmicutes bacterium]|nr:V-type ATPase subunit [Bacillota bacterium]